MSQSVWWSVYRVDTGYVASAFTRRREVAIGAIAAKYGIPKNQLNADLDLECQRDPRTKALQQRWTDTADSGRERVFVMRWTT